MSKKIRIPAWVYWLVFILGPATGVALAIAFGLGMRWLWRVLVAFDYWPQVAAVIGYAILGCVACGIVASYDIDYEDPK